MKRTLALIAIALCTVAFIIGGSVLATEASPVRRVDVCPSTGDWVKVDGLTGSTYTYTAPAGMLVAEVCYKHSTFTHYYNVVPPAASVTVTADWHDDHQYDLSHAAFRLTPVTTTPPPTTPPPTTPPPTTPPPTTPPPTTPPPTTPPPTTPPPTTPPPPTPPPFCERVPLYWQVEFFRAGEAPCYLVTWDQQEDGSFIPPSVRSQLCSCEWSGPADSTGASGWVYYNECTGEYEFDGKTWSHYDPDLREPHWTYPCASGGGGGDC